MVLLVVDFRQRAEVLLEAGHQAALELLISLHPEIFQLPKLNPT
jgi:hypothetical protein